MTLDGHGGSVDSSGVPWTGRTLPAAPFAGDEGRIDPALEAALSAYAAELRRGEDGSDRDAGSATGSTPDPAAEGALASGVVAALAAARIFVPIAAMPGEVGDDAADMALLTVTGPDGRHRLPAFTRPDTLATWRPDARPVPVPARQVALAAVAEGCDLLELDPAGPVPFLIRRPALWALAQARQWSPSYADPAVAHVVTEAVREASAQSVGGTVRHRLVPGEAAELRIVLGVPAGRAPGEIEALTGALTELLAASEVVAEQVDSLEIVLRALPSSTPPPTPGPASADSE